MWWFMLFPVLVGGVGFWSTYRWARQRLLQWQSAVEACGLQVVEMSSPAAWMLRLAARVGPVEVRIADNREGNKVVVVVPGPPGFSDVRIRRELRNPLPWVREIEIGDEPFDAAFYLGGPPPLLCALLDADTRKLLADLHGESPLEIVGGEVQAQMFGGQIPDLLPRLLDLARRLTRPVDIALQLATNVQRDPVAGVRLQNLLCLVREFAGHPRTAAALHAACVDASPQVRLRAAMELGAEGRDVLIALAEGTEDEGCSAQAVRVVGRDLPGRTREILVRALRRRRLQTAQACLEALGHSGTEIAVEALTKVLAREKGDLAATAAQALGETKSAAAEGPLIRALARDQADLRVAAANALARVGSAAAVLPLKDAAERFPRDQALRRATRQAIAEIQSRVQGASPGQLSLAGDEAGQLSLAQAEAGQLSFATDQAGQLSLSGGEERPKPTPGGAA